MANGYTATPGIIAGNLTVNGSITMNTDAGLRIGAAPPFVRLFKSAAPGLGLTYNLATDEATRDNTGLGAGDLIVTDTLNSPSFKLFNPAGSSVFRSPDTTLAQDGTNVNNTGSTTENTIYSKTVSANTLGADGALVVEFDFSAAVQGAVASNFRLRFGGVQFAVLVQTVGHAYTVRIIITNQNATNAQLVSMIAIDDTNAVFHTRNAFTVGTGVDALLAITAQSGAVGDSQTFFGWRVHALGGRTTPL